jgi:hypothetical protein
MVPSISARKAWTLPASSSAFRSWKEMDARKLKARSKPMVRILDRGDWSTGKGRDREAGRERVTS